MRPSQAGNVDLKFEVAVIPVSDVDRAKEFYGRLGWRLDADRVLGDNFRFVQYTPPGSGASVQFGVGLTSAVPGSARAMLLIVSDIEAARQQLVAQGIETTEVFHCESGTLCRFPGIGVRVSGPQPERLSYQSFVSFQVGRQWLGAARSYHSAGRARCGQHHVHIRAGSCPSDALCGKGPRAGRGTVPAG